jgi:hypothetical protein
MSFSAINIKPQNPSYDTPYDTPMHFPLYYLDNLQFSRRFDSPRLHHYPEVLIYQRFRVFLNFTRVCGCFYIALEGNIFPSKEAIFQTI